MRCRVALLLGLVGACRAESPAPMRCLTPPPAPGPVLLRVGDVDLSVPQLIEAIQTHRDSEPNTPLDSTTIRKHIDDQARFELLVRAAQDAGLDRDPEVVSAARKVMVRKLLQDKIMGDEPGLADEVAIVRYYDGHKADYQQAEKRRISEIELPKTDEGKRLAEQVLTELRAAANDNDQRNIFKMLALKHSKNAVSKARGGEHLHMDQAAMVASFGEVFANAVFTADASALLPAPVESARGWHVVKVLSKREALFRGLDEVRDDIKSKLMREHKGEKLDAYVAELKQQYPVMIFEPRLAELERALAPKETP